jgi:voltage-gated sodium channel type II alpha
VLNLFLALLLSNFGSSSLSAPTADNETNKIAEAFNRIARFKAWVKRSIANGFKYIRNKLTNQISVQPPGELRRRIIWIWNEGFYPLVYLLLLLL